jgi:hypothetical protein
VARRRNALGVGSRRKRHSSIPGTTRALAPSDRQRLGDRDLQTPEKEGVARGVTTRGEMSRVIKRQYTYLQGCNAQAVVSEDHIASAVIGPTAMMRSMKRGMPGDISSPSRRDRRSWGWRCTLPPVPSGAPSSA